MNSLRNILAVGVVAALVPAAAFAASAPQSPERAQASKTIVQTAVASGQFKTLVSLVKKAGLADELSAAGPYTVLAPTDAAFAKVPPATLRKLGRNRALLKRVLLYHVISGKAPASTVVTLKSAKTLAGPNVRIRVTGKRVFVNTARVTKTDVMASNGIIHVINRVLIPSS